VMNYNPVLHDIDPFLERKQFIVIINTN